VVHAALEVLVRALRDFHGAVVAPRWGNVATSFHAGVEPDGRAG
jgi:hypothetical protein